MQQQNFIRDTPSGFYYFPNLQIDVHVEIMKKVSFVYLSGVQWLKFQTALQVTFDSGC